MIQNGKLLFLAADASDVELDAEGFGDSYRDVNIACTRWLERRGLMVSLRDRIERSMMQSRRRGRRRRTLTTDSDAAARNGGELDSAGELSSLRSDRLSHFVGGELL
jgi:hypothetical protein